MTTVSEISGNIIVRFTVWVKVSVVKVLVVAPLKFIFNLFVISILPVMNDVVSDNDLFKSVSVVILPTNVSVVIGNVKVPVFMICAIIGFVNVFPDKVSVVARPTNVSVVVGNVNVPVFII